MLKKINLQIDELEKKFIATNDYTKWIIEVSDNLRKKELKDKFKSLTFKEKRTCLDEFDNFLITLLPNPDSLEGLVTRSSLLTILISDTEKTPSPQKIKIIEHPDNIKEAIKNFSLSDSEIHALEYVNLHTGMNIKNADSNIINTTKQIIFENIAQRKGNYMSISKQLEEAIGGDTVWQEVAVNEVNSAYNNGFLASVGVGRYVIGYTYPDACDHCDDLIKNKIYKIIDYPDDYNTLKPGSSEYNELSKIYDKYVWVCKNNIGRSKTIKTTKDGETFDKDHHLVWTPCLPLHTLCKCRWIEFVPTEMFIDGKGEWKFRIEHPDEHKEWYNNFKKRYE